MGVSTFIIYLCHFFLLDSSFLDHVQHLNDSHLKKNIFPIQCLYIYLLFVIIVIKIPKYYLGS